MIRPLLVIRRSFCAFAACLALSSGAATDRPRALVAGVVEPLMREYGIPGMAVAVIVDGRTRVVDFGVASTDTSRPVTARTLFEIGSDSKVFTATLASYAEVIGRLAWSDPVSRHLPALRGSAFDRITLAHLATHTAGGLPLQVPDAVTDDGLMPYLRDWRPVDPPGTTRVYSNVGIGLLGVVAARALDQPFDDAMERTLLPMLGLADTFLRIPRDRMSDYAQGYTRSGAPIRVAPGVLASQAYGIKTTARDLARFVAANLRLVPLARPLQTAIDATQVGWYEAGALTQDLIWEQVPYPTDLARLLAGNAETMIDRPNAATALQPPRAPDANTWIGKTGSTNGFSSSVAFVPARRIGIVLLANRNYPIAARVTAAYRIVSGILADADPAQ